MSLTVKVTCDRCGESVEASLAMQHLCRRLLLPDAEKLIEQFLDDLNARSGFALTPEVRKMIRAAWRSIAAHALRETPEPSSSG